MPKLRFRWAEVQVSLPALILPQSNEQERAYHEQAYRQWRTATCSATMSFLKVVGFAGQKSGAFFKSTSVVFFREPMIAESAQHNYDFKNRVGQVIAGGFVHERKVRAP